MMKRQTATAVAAVVLLLVTSTGAGLAVGPSDSLAHEFDSSTTDTSTVVVAVADPSTDEGRATLVAANAVASANNYTIVRVEPGEFPRQLVQTLSQRVKHGELRSAVVVGVGENNTDPVATALTAVGAEVGGDDVTLGVKDQITGESASDVLYRASVQQWDSSDAVFLTTNSQTETGKVSIALANKSVSGTPVLSASSTYTDVNATLDYLEASTVYVTPEVSTSTRDKLRNDGYSVVTAPAGVSLDQPTSSIAADYAPDRSEDVVVVGEPSHVYMAAQTGAGNNSTLLVTQAPDRLGNATKGELQRMNDADNVYVLGDETDVTSSVYSSVVSAAPSNASVDRVDRKYGQTSFYLRTSLLVSGYEHGVLTSHINTTGENVTVDVTNIGYSTVSTEVGNITASWRSGAVDESWPSGEVVNQRWIVPNADAMNPGGTFTVTLEMGSGEFAHGGHPVLDYSVKTDRNTFLPAAGGLGFFEKQVQEFAPWLAELVNPALDNLEFGEQWGLEEWAVVGAILLITLLVVRSFAETLKWRKRRESRSRNGRKKLGDRFSAMYGVFGGMTTGEVAFRLIALLIGGVLAAFALANPIPGDELIIALVTVFVQFAYDFEV